MKFQKTLLAVAIAGIAAAPMIAAADTTLSGIVEVKFAGSDAEEVAAAEAVEEDLTANPPVMAVEAVEASNGDVAISGNDVFFGIVSENEMNNGLTGYGSLRVDLNSLSGADAGGGKADNVYTGVKGGFGDLRLGEVPVAAEYGQVAGDLHDVTGDINGGLSYTGTFGGFGVGLNFSPENNEDAIGLGAKFGIGGFSIGVGGESRGEDTNVSAGASFAFAGASIGVHYWVQQLDVEGADDPTAIAVKVGYGFGGVDAALTFSQGENVADFESKMRIDLGYGLGGGTKVSTRININSDSAIDADDLTDWRIVLGKSF